MARSLIGKGSMKRGVQGMARKLADEGYCYQDAKYVRMWKK